MNIKELPIEEALDIVEATYAEITAIGDEMMAEHYKNANKILNIIDDDLENLSTKDIKNYMIKLGLASARLAAVKDKALSKFACAELIKKHEYSQALLVQEGTTNVKEAKASAVVAKEQVASLLYEYVAVSLKSKVDEIHRMVDILKSVLISNAQEAKMSWNTIDASENE